MGLPIYLKFTLQEDDKDFLLKFLNKTDWSSQPAYIIPTPNLNHMRVWEAINDFFEKKYLSFHFPYPTYMISPALFTNPDYELASSPKTMPVLEGINNLPRFYNRKTKIPNVKEQGVLEKVELCRQQCETIDFREMRESFEDYAKQQRKLFGIAREAAFYEECLKIVTKI